MLEVSQLSRTYGSFRAVDNVSFAIDKGEIVGLLGHNGAGKTTIMKMISGFLESDAGSVRVDGIDLAQAPKAVQKTLGYLPENLPVYPEMSVADYLDFAADLKGLQGDAKIDEIRRVVRATDIAAKLLAPIATLSRGLRQRVGVAQAILGRPRLLILDEPTNGLDPQQTQHMRALIRELAREATVILSTHIMQEVEALCSRVLMLRAGELALDARLDDLQHSNHLLLETSLAEAQSGCLAEPEGVAEVQALAGEGGATCYRVRLEPGAGVPAASAALAAAVAAAGADLYRLQPEMRDLETLFREVNEGGKAPREVSRAA